MSDVFSTPRERLILPFLSPFYEKVAQPFGWLAFRLVVGGITIQNGWGLVQAPQANAAFFDSIGIHPGALFSPIVAYVTFIGGILVFLGLFTRPAALANAALLLVTLWFHMAYPYGPTFLTPEGIAYLTEHPELLTASGQENLLPDGGAFFLDSAAGINLKAERASLFWAGAMAIFAAFGGGYYSVDRLLKKEF